VAASAVVRPVEVHAYPTASDPPHGRIVGEHPRPFARGQTNCHPWQYVPVLARKPGALRNGRPFKDWVCRPRWSACGASSRVPDGNRQMVDILTAVITDRLPVVEAACAQPSVHLVAGADWEQHDRPARLQRICRHRQTTLLKTWFREIVP
jgi:hypothetical protein